MKKLKILIIDEKDMTDLLRLELSEEGYEIMTMTEDKPVFENIKQANPDLIFLEPACGKEYNGLEIVRSLKADTQTKNIPIVVISSKTFDDEIQEALDIGVIDYITKPFYTPLLLRRIQNYVQTQK